MDAHNNRSNLRAGRLTPLYDRLAAILGALPAERVEALQTYLDQANEESSDDGRNFEDRDCEAD